MLRLSGMIHFGEAIGEGKTRPTPPPFEWNIYRHGVDLAI